MNSSCIDRPLSKEQTLRFIVLKLNQRLTIKQLLAAVFIILSVLFSTVKVLVDYFDLSLTRPLFSTDLVPIKKDILNNRLLILEMRLSAIQKKIISNAILLQQADEVFKQYLLEESLRLGEEARQVGESITQTQSKISP